MAKRLHAVHELKVLLNLEATIALFERDARRAKSGAIEIAPLEAACGRLGFWGGHRKKGRDWLLVYLRRRWGIPSGTFNEIAARLAQRLGKSMPRSGRAFRGGAANLPDRSRCLC